METRSLRSNIFFHPTGVIKYMGKPWQRFRLGIRSLLMLMGLLALTSILYADPLSRALDASRVPAMTLVSVNFHSDLELLVFNIELTDSANKAIPKPRGKLDTAPVLGFVVPTTLKPTDVGFFGLNGIVALAVTSHPDFDDTPLWDENLDRNYDNDGIIYHPHWVLLKKDIRVAGGFSVVQFNKSDNSVKLPPTNPGMPMAMDSPGFQVVVKNRSLRILVPSFRVNNNVGFNYDGVACYMEVNTSESRRPLLGVYKVYQVKSGDLSLPYTVSVHK